MGKIDAPTTLHLQSIAEPRRQVEARSLFQVAFERFRRHRLGLISVVVLLAIVAVSLGAPLFAGRNPNFIEPAPVTSRRICNTILAPTPWAVTFGRGCFMAGAFRSLWRWSPLPFRW